MRANVKGMDGKEIYTFVKSLGALLKLPHFLHCADKYRPKLFEKFIGGLKKMYSLLEVIDKVRTSEAWFRKFFIPTLLVRTKWMSLLLKKLIGQAKMHFYGQKVKFGIRRIVPLIASLA